MVQHVGTLPDLSDTTYEDIPKSRFAARAWDDAVISRQLIENYEKMQLSRLELIKVALECLMSRSFTTKYPGDRIYAMMSLLRIRPPIDRRDSSFQAFARLSFPQDSDRLMERLICLLPSRLDEDWELMTDQYKANIWNIHPIVQVCAVGENDTVVIDGAKGAQIQWTGFSAIRTTRRVTLLRQLIPVVIENSPFLVFTAIIVLASGARSKDQPTLAAGIALLVIGTLVLLSVPAIAPLMYQGKLWSAEPCLFGIEGYVPLDVIEARLFGKGLNRMRWSPFGSPLSRHREGEALRERAVGRQADYEDDDNDIDSEAGFLSPSSGFIDTYIVDPIDPTDKCLVCKDVKDNAHCKFHETPASCQDRSRSRMGELKVFTLVDTFSMTATLFLAVRPPVALVVCGSEGGMKRAIACSIDVTTGILYRETVLRIPSRCVDHMASLDRIRLGLRRPFSPSDVEPSASPDVSEAAPASSTGSLERMVVADVTPNLNPQPRPSGQPAPPRTGTAGPVAMNASPRINTLAVTPPPRRPRQGPVYIPSTAPRARHHPDPTRHEMQQQYRVAAQPPMMAAGPGRDVATRRAALPPNRFPPAVVGQAAPGWTSGPRGNLPEHGGFGANRF